MRPLLALALSSPLLAQTELAQLSTPDLRRWDQLGTALAIDGDHVLVGVCQADYLSRGLYDDVIDGWWTDWLRDAGAAYLIDRTSGDLVHLWRPVHPLWGGRMGLSVALRGSTAVVAEPWTGSGRAMVYDTATGALLFELAHPGFGHAFGYSVAIDDTRIAVGGPLIDVDGSVALFDRATGALVATIDAPAQVGAGLGFGWSVALDGGRLAVGAPGDHSPAHLGGRAYLFDAGTGALLQTVEASDQHAGMNFGAAVDLEGERLAVGAPDSGVLGVGVGAVYLFDAGSGAELSLLEPAAPTTQDQFGRSLALEGGRLLVGCRGEDVAGNESGAVYRFAALDGSDLGAFSPVDGQALDRFGSGLAVQGDVAVIGAMWANTFASQGGKLYLYDLND